MKIKQRLLIFYGFMFVAWIIFGSNASNPPNAHTNAPFDQFCTQCHGGGQFNATLEITGIPSMVDAGQTYPVTFTATATQGSPNRAGFQLVSVFDSNNENAGDLIASGSGVGTNTTNGREYIEHRGARNFNGGTVSWTFDWIAPNGPDGATIIMYYACNLTNGNGSTSGDRPISGSTSFILNADSAPLVAGISNQVNVSCNGDNDGSATADASGGVPPYTYAWSNGSTASTASALSAGNYMVTITDANMDNAIASVTINEPQVLSSSVDPADVLCNGDNSGAAVANPTGGTTPYSYSWSNGANTKTISNLTAGSYQVTITDANNCTTTRMATISQPDALEIEVTGTDESAPMSGDGTAMVSASGGTSPYEYLWSNGQSTRSISDLEPGTYSVTVSDGNGCMEIGMFTVQSLECSLQATISANNPSCFGASDGSAAVMVSGALEPVSYLWSNGQTTSEAINLTAGVYDVTVTDAGECETIVAVMIDDPQEIEVNFIVDQPSCPDASDGSVTANVAGGTAPYMYNWTDGAATNQISSISPGTYHLSVTDINGCEITDSVELISTDTLAPILVAQAGTIFLDSSGVAGIPLELPFVGGTDGCGIDSIWSTPSVFDCSTTGEQELTFIAADASGNQSQVTIIATVRDTIRPVFVTCVEDIEADSGSVINYLMPEATDNCGIDSFALTEGLPSGSVFPSGETKVSYMAMDASGNYECCSFFVRVGGTVASVDKEFSEAILLFPNPVGDKLQIKLPENTGAQAVEVSILTVSGQEVLQTRIIDNSSENIEINMTSISPGVYLTRIISEKRVGVRKIIKK